jgi:hypothetical protein
MLLVCLWPELPCVAQKDENSLTDEFPELSAKQRSRIAAKETEEAAQDKEYQRLMEAGEAAFRAGRLEEALGHYEAARVLRPYNVYPKVKIEDLKTMLKVRRPVAADTVVAAPSLTVQEQTPAPIAAPPPSPAQPAPVTASEKPIAPPVTPVVTPPTEKRPEKPATRLPEKPKQRPVPVEEPSPRKAPDGLEERRYQEGRAFVIERTIAVEGRAMIYKQVSHPTGQVFYFEDGRSVDARVWQARFNGR